MSHVQQCQHGILELPWVSAWKDLAVGSAKDASLDVTLVSGLEVT